MKKKSLIILFGLFLAACGNSGENKTTTDSSSVNTSTNNVSDGGPNNGRGDTNDYSRMNDVVKDSATKKDSIHK